TDHDLRATIELGVPGTSMPGFGGVLNDTEIGELVAIVRAFGPPAAASRPITLGQEPTENPGRGAALWTQLGCDRCHGADGHGTATVATYDLVAEPIHRPRQDDSRANRRRA